VKLLLSPQLPLEALILAGGGFADAGKLTTSDLIYIRFGGGAEPGEIRPTPDVPDLIVRAEAIAKANTLNVIEPYDLPVPRGLQDRVNEFRKLDEALGLEAEFDRLVKRPPTDLDYSEDTERKLVSVAGGLSLALARSFKVIDPEVKNPSSRHWEQAYALYDLVL